MEEDRGYLVMAPLLPPAAAVKNEQHHVGTLPPRAAPIANQKLIGDREGRVRCILGSACTMPQGNRGHKVSSMVVWTNSNVCRLCSGHFCCTSCKHKHTMPDGRCNTSLFKGRLFAYDQWQQTAAMRTSGVPQSRKRRLDGIQRSSSSNTAIGSELQHTAGYIQQPPPPQQQQQVMGLVSSTAAAAAAAAATSTGGLVPSAAVSSLPGQPVMGSRWLPGLPDPSVLQCSDERAQPGGDHQQQWLAEHLARTAHLQQQQRQLMQHHQHNQQVQQQQQQQGLQQQQQQQQLELQQVGLQLDQGLQQRQQYIQGGDAGEDSELSEPVNSQQEEPQQQQQREEDREPEQHQAQPTTATAAAASSAAVNVKSEAPSEPSRKVEEAGTENYKDDASHIASLQQQLAAAKQQAAHAAALELQLAAAQQQNAQLTQQLADLKATRQREQQLAVVQGENASTLLQQQLLEAQREAASLRRVLQTARQFTRTLLPALAAVLSVGDEAGTAAEQHGRQQPPQLQQQQSLPAEFSVSAAADLLMSLGASLGSS